MFSAGAAALLSGCTALLLMSVSTPTFTPTGGTYSSAQLVAISVSKPTDATIRYTTDGSDPTPSHGTVYTTPISIAKTTTVKAVAYRSGWLNSKTASESYAMNLTTRTFTVPNIATGTYYSDPATLMATGTDCLVYVENSSISSVSQTTAQAIADRFDTVIYPLDTQNFGATSDVDHNGKVILFILNIQDGYSGSSSGYVAGFFNPSDLFSGPTSNDADMLYLDDNPGDPGTDTFYSTIAHELQHLINYNVRILVDGFKEENTWINEGLSTAAEGLYDAQEKPGGYSYDKDRVDYYNGANGFNNSAIAAGENFVSWQGTVDSYVTDYLFFEWMKQQIDSGGGNGPQLFKSILDNPAKDYTAVRDEFTHALSHAPSPPTNAPTSWAGMLQDWFIANYLNKYSPSDPLYSYGSAAFQLTAPQFTAQTGGTYSLKPGEGIYIPISSSWTPSSTEPDISYIGVKSDGTIDTSSPYSGDYVIAFNTNGSTTAGASTTSLPPDILPAPSVVTKTMVPAKPMPIDVIFGADGKPRTAGIGSAAR